MQDFLHLITLLIALVLVLPFDRPFGRKLNEITKAVEPRAPAKVDDEAWKGVIWTGKKEDYVGGRWIGRFEVFMFLAALSFDKQIIIGAWLAFKVATKWEVWRNVVRVPETLKCSEEISWLQSRTAWGTWLLNRFLLGTIGNLAIAFVAFIAANSIIIPACIWIVRNWDKVLAVICPAAVT